MNTDRHEVCKSMFKKNHLSLGLYLPIEAYEGKIPTMINQVALAKRAEQLGFRGLWFRDIPLFDPEFGEVGQIYDPWTYMGYIAAQTSTIAICTGSIVLPLRHPLHVAKAATSIDVLSGGRLVLGVASGDRPLEYSAFGVTGDISERFRESFLHIRRTTENSFPIIESARLGRMIGADVLPKPFHGSLSMLVTGSSLQTLQWIAENADGWLNYPRNPIYQAELIEKWRSLVEESASGQFKPFAQPLRIDLLQNPDASATSIPLGLRVGRNELVEYLKTLESIGVNHVILVLKNSRRPVTEVIHELGEYVLPLFHTEAYTNSNMSFDIETVNGSISARR